MSDERGIEIDERGIEKALDEADREAMERAIFESVNRAQVPEVWRLMVERGFPNYGSLVFSRSAYDPLTGERYADKVPAGGSEVLGFPIGYTATRSYFAHRYDPENPQPPSCHSQDFIVPDAVHYGKYSNRCVDRYNLAAVVCPKAKWGETEDGKPIRPECQEQFCVIFGLYHSGLSKEGLALAEVYFKGVTTRQGRHIIRRMIELRADGEHPYDRTLKLTVQPVKKGSPILTIFGELLPDPFPRAGADPEVFAEDCRAASQTVLELINGRLRNSRIVPEKRQDDYIDAKIEESDV